MKAIAAMAENRAIGKNGELPWKPIKEDFKWFKELTTGKILVVGNKTFDTIPALKNRNLVVLTGSANGYEDIYDPFNNMAFCYRNREDILHLDNYHKGELVVIGGAKTYELFLPYITKFYVTHVKGVYDADTFMPSFEHLFSTSYFLKKVDEHPVFYYSR